MSSILLLANPKEKIIYFPMYKVGSRSIQRTLFSSVAERAYWDEQVKKDTGGKIETIKIRTMMIFFPSKSELNADFTSSSIIGFRYWEEKKEWERRSYNQKIKSFQDDSITKEELQSYFTFTFVRNPFTRLVSFFQNKFMYREDKLYHSFHYTVEGFADFLHIIVKEESEKMNLHFCPQAYQLHQFRQAGGKVDFIGKIENMEKDFEGLREKHNLLPLERFNQSGKQNALHKNWQDYYTPELAKLVFDRWRDDFIELGYENEYPKLLAYLNAPVPLRFRRQAFFAKLGITMRFGMRKFFAKLGLPAYKRYLP